MNWIKAFVAGFLATLVFHQGLLGLLYLAGAAPMAPFNMTPVEPLGIPQFLSLAFWGGVWGLPAWLLIASRRGAMYWVAGVLFGAVFPTAVAMLVVFPLKGLAVTPVTVAGGLLLNGAWGFGVCLAMRLMMTRPA